MTLDVRKSHYSIAEYLVREREALEKHEYRDGEILLMAGGTVNDSLAIANVISTLHGLLRGKPCNVFDSNLRIRIPRTILYTYPDISVICGPRMPDPNDSSGETMTNPKVIVEVLSPSTEAYDRGEKFARYRQLDSLEEYVLVSLVTARVESFYRAPLAESGASEAPAARAWIMSTATGTRDAARLRSLNVDLPLDEVYRGIEFPAAEPSPSP